MIYGPDEGRFPQCTITPFLGRFAIARPLYASDSREYHNGTYGKGIVGERIRGRATLEPGRAVAALLRIARVQTALDRDRARRTFEQALDELLGIPGRYGASFLDLARLFAAAIAPDLLPSISCQIHRPRHLDAESLGWIMMEHGNLDPAMELAMNSDDASTFPFSLAGMLMERVSEQERLAPLRRAVEAWREAHGDWFASLYCLTVCPWIVSGNSRSKPAATSPKPDLQFVWLFQHRWKLLPQEEARDVVREIVRVTLSEPDKPTQATYDHEGTIQITSSREHTLFQILHILRHLDQPLLGSLLIPVVLRDGAHFVRQGRHQYRILVEHTPIQRFRQLQR